MTTDTGLTTRLRQHSRRGGLAVALAMVLTTAICIGGFAVIYAKLQPFISDFVSQEPPPDNAIAFNIGRDDDTPSPTASAEDEQPAANDEEIAPEGEGDDEAPPADDSAPAPTQPPPPPTPTPAGFQPDYQLRGAGPVNLRAGPGTDFEVVIVLTPLQPLQYLGEEAPTNNPEDGPVWMRFRTQDGLEGWVRQIDVEPYDPNA